MTHKGRLSFHPACLLPSCPPPLPSPPPYRWQASRRITLPQPVNSPVVPSFVCANKRDLRELWEASMVRASAAGNDLEPVAVEAERDPWFHLVLLPS